MSYGTGVELHLNRMTAYDLHRKACKACCDFLGDQFASMKTIEDYELDLQYLITSLNQISAEYDKLGLGDDQ